MSRGPGRVQRFVLEEVGKLPPPDDPAWPYTKLVTVEKLAERLWGEEPTTAQMVSIRRAVRQLRRAGEVATTLVDVGTRKTARLARYGATYGRGYPVSLGAGSCL